VRSGFYLMRIVGLFTASTTNQAFVVPGLYGFVLTGKLRAVNRRRRAVASEFRPLGR